MFKAGYNLAKRFTADGADGADEECLEDARYFPEIRRGEELWIFHGGVSL
jgi:hypothetical protein